MRARLLPVWPDLIELGIQPFELELYTPAEINKALERISDRKRKARNAARRKRPSTRPSTRARHMRR